jgi:DNA-directed RNA polymerase specialized sigma24 family protein
MGVEILADDTTAVFREFVAGETIALEILIDRFHGKMVEMANWYFRRLQMENAAYDGEGAVNLTLAKLFRRAQDGELQSIETGADFWKLFSGVLKSEIRETRDRDAARKRGGPGSHERGPGRVRGERHAPVAAMPRQGFRRSATPLESLDSRQPPLAELVLMMLEVEEFLQRIDDPTNRKIATMKLDGYTNREIARVLGLKKKTVERKLENIRTTYFKYSRCM